MRQRAQRLGFGQRQESPKRHCGNRQCDAELRIAAGRRCPVQRRADIVDLAAIGGQPFGGGARLPFGLCALEQVPKIFGMTRKSPAKRRAGPAFGYAGDGLPSRCIRRYRLPSRCTRQKFHACPEQRNGPAADGASFSLTLKFIGAAFSFRYQDNSGLGESFRPLSSPASVNCVRAEGLSRLTSLLRETRLRGWACRTRTQKCRPKLSL